MAKGERNGKLESMREIFPEALREMKIGKEFKQRLVIYKWPEIVGKGISRNAKPVKLEFKKLFVRTTHPAWAEQLRYLQFDIKAKINAYFGEVMVEDLIFTNQVFEKKKSVHAISEEKPEINFSEELKKVVLTDEELSDSHKACSFLENEQLREKCEIVSNNLKRLARYRKEHNWHICGSEDCDNICPPEDAYCLNCRQKFRQKKKDRIRQLLWEMPWSKYGDIVKEVPCTEADYSQQRTALMQKLAGEVEYGDTSSLEAYKLVMLYRSLTPAQLTDQIVEKTLKRLRYDVCYVDKRKKDGKAEGSEGGNW